MKLSFGFFVALTVTVLTFLAVFCLSAIVFDNLSTNSRNGSNTVAKVPSVTGDGLDLATPTLSGENPEIRGELVPSQNLPNSADHEVSEFQSQPIQTSQPAVVAMASSRKLPAANCSESDRCGNADNLTDCESGPESLGDLTHSPPTTESDSVDNDSEPPIEDKLPRQGTVEEPGPYQARFYQLAREFVNRLAVQERNRQLELATQLRMHQWDKQELAQLESVSTTQVFEPRSVNEPIVDASQFSDLIQPEITQPAAAAVESQPPATPASRIASTVAAKFSSRGVSSRMIRPLPGVPVPLESEDPPPEIDVLDDDQFAESDGNPPAAPENEPQVIETDTVNQTLPSNQADSSGDPGALRPTTNQADAAQAEKPPFIDDIFAKTIAPEQKLKPQSLDEDKSSRINQTDQVEQQASSENAELERSIIVGWPLPNVLIRDLEELQKYPATKQWADAAFQAFQQLNQLELRNPTSMSWLTYAEELGMQLNQYAAQLAESGPQYSQAAIQLTRVAYRIQRRIPIWIKVHQIALGQSPDQTDIDPTAVARNVSDHRDYLAQNNFPKSWIDYLKLDHVEEVFSNPKSSINKRRGVSRKVLARVTSNGLTQEQSQYARELLGQALIETLQTAATGSPELGKFLDDLEEFESRSSAAADARLNNHFQNFYWNRDPQLLDLAKTVNGHFRNANFRIAFTDQFANRFLPQNQSFSQPVSDRILGANVVGQSRVSNQLAIQFIPDNTRLNFRLQSSGKVLSRTRAHHSSGFVLHTAGKADVNAVKGIAIGKSGVSLNTTRVAASSQQQLLNIRSRLDGIPLVGWAARRMAQQQSAKSEPQAKRIVENRLRMEVRNRMDAEIQTQINQARQWIQRNLFSPLGALELEPTAMEMRTTNRQAIVRYRLAGPDQMAANTARPQALPNSLVDVQIHHTAINNILNRIQINGQQFTTDQFINHINDLLGGDFLQPAPANGNDVSFEFASRDGVRIDFYDDQISVSLRLKKLKLGKRGWRNLIVKADYIPQAFGTQIKMLLDDTEGVSVARAGRKLNFSDQVAVRTVFNAVFKTDFEFALIPSVVAAQIDTSDLSVTQLIITDGWLGISIGDQKTAWNQQRIWSRGSSGSSRHSRFARPINGTWR